MVEFHKATKECEQPAKCEKKASDTGYYTV